jgi:DNA-binding HxlR family transcriptional regulator
MRPVAVRLRAMSLSARATGSDARGSGHRSLGERPACCPYYHEAVELIGRRWTGAIVAVLLDGGPMRFSQIAHAVPELSDRLLSERMKELEARGVVTRHVDPGPPVKVLYELTDMGRSLEPALAALKSWGRRWLREDERASARPL